ncbi:flagellar biosynthetic protein FliO [Solirubrobacter phytolaccae]|uniref:Flagellar biosynthetic protein FliO n=1 Tax=Solirubrobacter phytolaccae TaxID=1404360 RepID=A0A9X3S9W9_9ACTN|nr:flagellar biosynthetic protein FliO [Solirubrobacter phytolaccae]MDA0183844.1 flagellar biosynthetic protein FliO [Solirubrobacter phytolaccae]
MRTLHAFFPAAAAATFGCLLTAPVAFASEDDKLNLNAEAGKTTETAAGASGGSIVRTILGLVVVLGVIYGLHWVLKQVKAAKDTGETGESLENIATLNLGTNRSLHLVRVGGEIVLLGAAEHQVTPIRRYSEAEAYSLGLLEPPSMTLASLEAEVETPKGLMNLLRAKTVVK